MIKPKIWLIFLSITVFCLQGVLLAYYHNWNEKEFATNGLRNDFSIAFTLGKIYKKSDMLKDLFQNNRMKNYIIQNSAEFNRRGGTVGVLCKGNFHVPYLKSGRFFDASDFYHGVRVAVIGSKHESNTKKIEGHAFIELFGYDYRVIGVLEDYFDPTIDTLIYYNLDSAPKVDGLFFIDAMTSSSCSKQFDTVTTRYSAERLNIAADGINRMYGFGKHNTNLIMYATIFVTLLWLLKVILSLLPMRNLLNVLHLVGCTYKKTATYFVDAIIWTELISIIAYLFALVVVSFTNEHFYDVSYLYICMLTTFFTILTYGIYFILRLEGKR